MFSEKDYTTLTLKTYIHLGQHKTGTTSIQSFLLQRKQELSEQGIFIPTHFCKRNSTNHYKLNMICLNEGKSSPAKDRFEGSLGILKDEVIECIKQSYNDARNLDAKAIVWSNEGLSFLRTKEEYKRLADLFRPYSTKQIAILSIRDKDEFKLSWEKQLKRMGLDEKNPNPNSYKYLEDESWMLDWSERLSLIAQEFDQVKIWKYKKNVAIKNFLELIDAGNLDNHPTNDKIILNKTL